MIGTDALLIGEPKKRGRKSKKQLEKELLKEYNYDIESDNDKYIFSQKSMYENIHHLSSMEKTKFENKFTKPKDGVQRDYHNLLSQKTKKIVVATGPAGLTHAGTPPATPKICPAVGVFVNAPVNAVPFP